MCRLFKKKKKMGQEILQYSVSDESKMGVIV